jgi:hypothetical protein
MHKGDENLIPFVKGQSGNPKGRPKGQSLKEFARIFLMSLPDEEKATYLSCLPEELVWKMAEGNPQTDVTSKGEKLMPTPILGGITNEIHSDNGSKENPSPEKTS